MPEQPPRWVLHVDLDAYVAAVEIRRRPELTGRPVVVGGDGDPTRARQVVMTASYEAREFGVRSGMPLRVAARRCPGAVFLPSDSAAYDAASQEVMDALRSSGAPVEVWGWDEAFVGSELASLEGAVDFAEQLRVLVLERTSLTCAVGVGESRLHAKTAAGFAKRIPGERRDRGRVASLTRHDWLPVMGDQPTTALWGVGPRTGAKLAAHGLHTVGDLARADRDEMSTWFGPTTGPHLRALGRGGGRSPLVTQERIPKSRSHQVTFPEDLTDPDEIASHVAAMAAELTTAVAAEGRTVTHVGVTVRTKTFYTRTKTGKLPETTTDPDAVAAGSQRVLARFEIDRPVRLLGVQVHLADPQ